MLATTKVKKDPTDGGGGAAAEKARTLVELCARNSTVGALEAEIDRLDRASRGRDELARAEAIRDLPALRVKFAAAKVEQTRAQLSHDKAKAEWRVEQEAVYRPRYVAAVRKLDEKLESAREANQEVAAVWYQAKLDGVWGLENLSWPELTQERPSMGTRLDAWRTYLRRNGWLG